MCTACGDCILDLTAGICPVARCAKSLMNGPCGGSVRGKCEVNPDKDCVWHLIYHRLTKLNQLHLLGEIIPPKRWAVDPSDAGPRKRVKRGVGSSWL